jgi:hypothetical protein
VRFTSVRIAATVAAAAAVLVACSSNGDSGGGSGGGSGNGSGISAASPEKPKFTDDFSRTCADGIGFPGTAAYTKKKGAVHKAVVMTKTGNTWVTSTPSDFPKAWTVGYPEDAAHAELVVCYQRLKATPAGKTCEMQDDKTHDSFTVTMYNTQYRLQVLDARTGKPVYQKLGEAKSTRCPFVTFTSGDDDRTKYYTDATPADYRGLVKPYIAP